MNQTAICNLALLRLGITQGIASIDDPSATARACKTVWEQCIQTMLRERPWPFATRFVDLAQVGEFIVPTWLYSYRYPTSYIAVHGVIPSTETGNEGVIYTSVDSKRKQTEPFSVGSDTAGRLIHTDCRDAQAFGTIMITDTNLFDPMFNSALAWFIAAEIALSVTKSRDLINMANMKYAEVISAAFAAGENEPAPRMDADADMIAARL